MVYFNIIVVYCLVQAVQVIIGPVLEHKSEETTILKIELLPHMIMCVAGWRRGGCGDSVPHDWLARGRQTRLHCLSTGAAGHGHWSSDELWQETHHCHLQVSLTKL